MDPMSRKKTDEGAILGTDEAAIVVCPDGTFRFYSPKGCHDEFAMESHDLLAAIAIKLDDEQWVESMLAMLRRSPQGAHKPRRLLH
jgi:hypothetical protein